MNATPIKIALRQVGGWGAIIFFVVLLTLTFSFLGTILCALLAGMMLGASKKSRWVSVPVSAIFPVVIFTVLRASKADLSGGRIMLVALLCFGAFWFMYLLTLGVLVFERKTQSSPEGNCTAEATLPVAPPEAGSESGNGRSPTELSSPAEAGLGELAGRWVCEAAGADGQVQTKILEIAGGKLELSVVDYRGRAVVVAKGEVRLESPPPVQAIAVTGAARVPGPGPGENGIVVGAAA